MATRKPWILVLLLAACGGVAPKPDGATEEDPRAGLEAQLAARGVFPEERPTRVTLLDVRSGAKVGLLNEATTSKSEYYSAIRADAAYKVVSDLDMGALLHTLESLGFWENAAQTSGRVRGASVMIQVERGGTTFTLGYSNRDTAERIKVGVDCKETVRAFYDVHTSYQTVESDRGAQLFLESIEGNGAGRG